MLMLTKRQDEIRRSPALKKSHIFRMLMQDYSGATVHYLHVPGPGVCTFSMRCRSARCVAPVLQGVSKAQAYFANLRRIFLHVYNVVILAVNCQLWPCSLLAVGCA